MSTRRKRSTQLALFGRKYRVRAPGCDVVVTAQTPKEAGYRAFKFLREAGYYSYRGGFFAFLRSSVNIKEVDQ